MNKKPKKKSSGAKIVVPFIQDPNVSSQNIILHDKDELLDYIKDNILEVLKPGEQETYVIGFTKMTLKQLNNLPDIDD